MIIRVRSASGQSTLRLEPETSVAELQALLAGATGIEPACQEILAGFPPQPLQLPEDRSATSVAALGVQAGDSLTVNRTAAAVAQPPPAAAHAAGAAAGAADFDHDHFNVAGMSEDEQLARALALSMEEHSGNGDAAAPPHQQPQEQPSPRSAAAAAAAARAPPPGSLPARPAEPPLQQQPKPRPAPTARPASPVRSHPAAAAAPRGVATLGSAAHTNGGAQPGPAPTAVALPGGSGAVARRIIASDNSCLFNAVGYVMERSRSRAPALRRLIAQEVAADPVQWNEAVLGKSPAEYCAWIQHPDKWGGAIELSILSKHYGREIAAFDIQTKRVDIYGQDAGYSERVMVIYDGLHYDALAVAAYPGAPEGTDVTVLPSSGPRTDEVMAGAALLVAKAHAARQFTDTANFTLRCGVCQIGLKGEAEAVQHAKATSHTNFVEYA